MTAGFFIVLTFCPEISFARRAGANPLAALIPTLVPRVWEARWSAHRGLVQLGERIQKDVSRSVGIALARGHLLGELVELGASVHVAPARAERGERDRLDLVTRPPDPAPLELSRRLHPGTVLVDGLDDLFHALADLGDRQHDRRLPDALGPVGQRDHRPQLSADLLGAVAVCLVDDVDVADLEDARLRRLH